MMRMMISLFVAICLDVGLSNAVCHAAEDSPLVEKYLLDGKLADGVKALQDRLRRLPKTTRLGLDWV